MRNCECIGIPSMFRSRVMGVGSVLPKELVFDPGQTNGGSPTPGNTGIGGYRAQVCHPQSPAGTCKPVDWKPDDDAQLAEYQKKAAEIQKKLKGAESWRSNTPIASWSAASPSGNINVIKVFGYNKDLGAVWINEGADSRAEDSMIVSDAVLSSRFPEWAAAKASLGKSGSALPLLLGAAYLLLS